MKENDNSVEERLNKLREEIRHRIADIDAGHGIEIETDEELTAFFNEIEEEVRREMGG